MPDEVVTTEAAPVADVAGIATPDPVGVNSYIGSDGAFQDGWKDHVSEEYRGERCLDLFGDFNGMVKTLVHGQKAFGKDKIILPTDTSPPSDWDAFHKAIGRPETVDDYAINRPESIPPDRWNTDEVSQFKALAHKIGLTQGQVEQLSNFQNVRTIAGIANADQQATADHEAAEERLRAEFGAAYDERIHLANRLIKDTVEVGEEREELLSIIGNNPVVIKWIAEMGGKLVESRSVDTRINQQTPGEMQTEIAELTATPGYMNGVMKRTNLMGFKALHDKITRLYEEQAKAG